jgi:hypothetical protein
VWPSWSAQDADEANAHVSATGSTGTITVHGLGSGSNVVGTTDTQTLTNKTLSGGTVTGAITASGATLTSPTVTGATINNSAVNLTLNAQTGTAYTLALTDNGKLVTLNNASAITVTVPLNSSVAFPVGAQVNLARIGTGAVAVTGVSGVTVNATPTLNFRAQWSSATAIKIATDSWLLVGDLAS